MSRKNNFNKSDKKPKNLPGETGSVIYNNLKNFDKIQLIINKISKLKNMNASLIDGFTHIFYLMYRFFTTQNTSNLYISMLYVIRNFYKDFSGQQETFIQKKLRSVIKCVEGHSYSSKIKSEGNIEFTDTLRILVHSKIFKVVREFVLDLVSLRFFSFGTSKFFIKTLGKPEAKPVLDACIDICESMERMFVFLRSAWKKGTLKGVLLEDAPLLRFYKLYEQIQLSYPHIYIGDSSNFEDEEEAEGRMSATLFIEMLREAISLGSELLFTHNEKDIKAKLLSLKNIFSLSLHKLHSRDRKMPIGFVVHGKPGVGKTSIMNHINKLFCHKKGLNYSKDLVFDRKQDANFWDGFDPLTHRILHYPEVGAKSSRLATTHGDPVVEELLKVMDTAPYQAEQASLENKGKYFVNPDMVIIDTNNEKMNIEKVVSNPAAVRRRFVYIHASVKEIFRKENSESLDTEKVALLKFDEDGVRQFHDMDIFKFDIYHLVPKDNVNSDKKVIASNVDIFALTDILNGLIDQHELTQNNLRNILQDDIENYISQSSHTVSFTSRVYSLLTFFFLWCVDFYNSSWSSRKNKINLLYLITIIWFEDKFGRKCTLSTVADEFFNSHWYGDTVLICYLFTFGLVAYKTLAQSQGDYIDSSEEYDTIETCQDYVNDMSVKSGVEFPRAVKKDDNSKDYDNPITMFPRIISESRNYNDFEEVCNSAKSNVRKFKISYTNGCTNTGYLLGICGDYAVINSHYFPPGFSVNILEVSTSSRRLNYRRIKRSSFRYKDLGNDVTLIKLYAYQFSDIRFLISDEVGKYNDIYSKIKNTLCESKRRKNVIINDKACGQYVITGAYEYVWEDNKPGQCGTPLMGKINNQTFLLGIHAASGSNKSYSVPITTSVLTNINSFGDGVLHDFNSEGKLRLRKDFGDVGISPVSNKSPLLYEDTSGVNVIGSISNYKFVTPKSKLVKSPLLRYTSMLIGVSPYNGRFLKYDKPLMRSRRDVNGEYINPYNIFTRKVSVVKKTLSLDLLHDTVNWISDYLDTELTAVGITKLSPVGIDVALNGAHSNFFMRSMKMSTSAGFSFPGGKSRYLLDVEGSDKKQLGYDVYEQVCEILRSYDKEETSLTILGAQLKDEPRTRDKCQKGKTRVFAMSPLDATLVQRMFLMSFYSLMVEHRSIFKTAIGANMHSDEAHMMYIRMTEFSDKFLLGDYGGYDTSMPIGIGHAANSIVYSVLQKKGYNETALRMVKGILNDNLFPILSLEGNLFQVPGFQPSGKYATAEDNSLRNLVLLIYSFRDLCNGTNIDINKPFDYLLPYIYGDDLVCSVKEEVLPYFNNITYAKYCDEVYGMKFTTTDKKQHTKESCGASEIEFLKRTFKYHHDLNRYVAALNEDSLVKTMSWLLPSKDISLNNQAVESLISVATELFFHTTCEEDYKIKYEYMVDILNDLGSASMKDSIPKYSTLVKKYKSNVGSSN